MNSYVPTPIQSYGRLCEAEIYIKREDLLPFSFGGNKVRIAEEVFAEAKKRGAKRIISYGSTSSNLNRVMAHMAAREKMACTVIVKKEGSDAPEMLPRTAKGFNEQMLLTSDAELLYTEAEKVRETVADTLEYYRAGGENPFYIYGDETGKGGEEVLARAYRKAAAEIRKQEKELGICFDTVVLPVGTGATLSGLAEGMGGEKKILGISVARTKEKIRESLTEAAGKRQPEILDSYLMGGYGNCTPELSDFIHKNLREHGLPLDPTYTGKAFYGMTEEIRTGKLEGKVLFLHTGGLPLFFDFLNR